VSKARPKVVQPHTDLPPAPAELGEFGTRFWHAVHEQYDVTDSGGLMLLRLACAALDRAEACRQEIAERGQLIQSGRSLRDNPLLKVEIAARALVVRCIDRLGLDLEPIRPTVGRPSGR
jgi:hypothetical protein